MQSRGRDPADVHVRKESKPQTIKLPSLPSHQHHRRRPQPTSTKSAARSQTKQPPSYQQYKHVLPTKNSRQKLQDTSSNARDPDKEAEPEGQPTEEESSLDILERDFILEFMRTDSIAKLMKTPSIHEPMQNDSSSLVMRSRTSSLCSMKSRGSLSTDDDYRPRGSISRHSRTQSSSEIRPHTKQLKKRQSLELPGLTPAQTKAARQKEYAESLNMALLKKRSSKAFISLPSLPYHLCVRRRLSTPEIEDKDQQGRSSKRASLDFSRRKTRSASIAGWDSRKVSSSVPVRESASRPSSAMMECRTSGERVLIPAGVSSSSQTFSHMRLSSRMISNYTGWASCNRSSIGPVGSYERRFSADSLSTLKQSCFRGTLPLVNNLKWLEYEHRRLSRVRSGAAMKSGNQKSVLQMVGDELNTLYCFICGNFPHASVSFDETSLSDSLEMMDSQELPDKSRADRLTAAVQALYSTQMDKPDPRVRDGSGVSQEYRELFESQHMPLTEENLKSFVHDLGVATMERLCQKEPRICCPRHDFEPRPQTPGRLRWTTVHCPEMLKQLVNRTFLRRTRSQPRHEKNLRPWVGISEGSEFPPFTLSTDATLELDKEDDRMAEERDETLVGVPMDKEYKDFQRDFFRRMEEAATKRKSLRNRKRWLKAYRKVQTVLRICRNLAERCLIFELEPSTYVDIGDSVTVSVDYGAGRSIDTDVYKRKNEISINSQVVDTLTSMPEERTLVQLEEARRELQKVQVFSEYPLSVQEQVLRRSFYLTVGPKRVILRQGHMSQNFYIIICGEAYVKEHLWDEPSGKMVAKAAAFIKTGDVFGSNAIIRGLNRGSSVISRTNIQLLAIHGDDYLDLIFRRALPDELPPHIQYLSGMTFMENFPIQLLREKLNVASMHHFRRNTVITHDSSTCTNLFIVKYGYCKVFRKLDEKEKTAVIDLDAPKSTSVNKRLEEGWGAGARKGVVAFDAEKKTETTIDSLHQSQTYIERDSPYVNYLEMLSPAGHLVRVPLTKLPGRYDKMHNQPLTLPSDQRRFLPLITMREGEVFGLDQTPMCPFRRKSRSTILVSLGAEVIALSKDFYCRHAAKEAHELAQKTFIYDNRFIRHRLRERVNRDVHLEEVLKHYFLKASTTAAELQNTGAGGVHGVEEEAHP